MDCWWAVSGDVPCDYISRGSVAHPRAALRAFARKWREVSGYMLRGEPHPNITIGTPDQWPELGDLLRRRALILQRWVEDNALWVGELAEPNAPRNRRTARRLAIRKRRGSVK